MAKERERRNRTLEPDLAPFLRSVYRMALGTGAAGGIGFSLWSIETGLSFAIGVAIGLGVLKSLECMVRRCVVPEGERRMGPLVLLGVAKYPFLLLGLYLLFRTSWLNVFTLAAGLGVPQIALLGAALRRARFANS